MFSSIMYLIINVIIAYIFIMQPCVSEMLLQPAPSLYLHSPGELEFTDVLVKRAGDNLTLSCELRGDTSNVYVWNFVPQDGVAEKPYTIERNGSYGSRLLKQELSVADSGRYVCSAPPFSVTKYILVQPYSGMSCARGAFSCGSRCVLAAYVCDGRGDCLHAEDEAPELCGPMPCARSDRLNCSGGRCIPEAACCRSPGALCRQPACCDEHPPYAIHGAFVDVEMPPVFDDRHATDDYGFIQSTIYTVTACALIFMIAVVLLVSAICKMQMKRAALRTYTRQHCVQRHRFPPCYEAAALLQEAPIPLDHQQWAQAPASGGRSPDTFSARYHQVPTQCTEVEMTTVSSNSGSPRRECFQPPVETSRPTPNRLTLHLGRFQLSIPRFGRTESRPDTPNVAEINIDDLDFVRLNSNDTYTLNGRTIRLLGGNFENYPPLSHGNNPPPYNEAMRYKLYGPPPEYLSRDRLNRSSSADLEARSNVEMPPGYEELGGNRNNDGASGNNGNSMDLNNCAVSNPIVINRDIIMSNILENICSMSVGRGNFEIGESSGCSLTFNNEASTSLASYSNNGDNNNGSPSNDVSTSQCNVETVSHNNNPDTNNVAGDVATVKDNDVSVINGNNDVSLNNGNHDVSLNNGNNDASVNNGNMETLNSVIDNLPAIDSDVNANDNVGVSC